ncbi:hypothetical protein ACFWQL_40455 [Amycolatopsis thermoflava]
MVIMVALPETLSVRPDRGLIGLYGEQVDVFDYELVGTRTSEVLVSNDYEAYIRIPDTLDPVRLHFGTGDTDETVLLGRAEIEVPTGELVVSEITRGVHGPFELPDGPGIYALTVEAPADRATGAAPDDLWLRLERTGDPTREEDED